MSLIRALAHNTAWQITGKGISTLLGLLAVAIMTRSLGAEQFGWYSTAIGFLQFAGILCDFSFIINTAKMLSEPQFDKKTLFNNLFTWRLITAILFQGAAVGIIWLFPYNNIIKIAVSILAISFVANIVNQAFVGYYQNRLKMIIPTIGEILGRMALVAGVAFLAWGKHGFLGMMWVVSIAAVISTLYSYYNSDGIKLQIHSAVSRVIFQKMWPTALGVILNAFYLQGDRVLLPLYVSAADVGFYGAAYRVLDIIAQIAFLTMGIILPLLTYSFSRNLKQEFQKYYQLGFDLMMFLLLPMVVGVIVLSSPIMNLVAGAEFAPAGKMLAYLAISSFGVCLGMMFGQTALSMDKQKTATWVYGIDAVLSVIGYLIFIPRYGVYGAAGVTIFSEFFAGVGLFLICRQAKFVLRLKTVGKIILASAVMGFCLVVIQPLNIFLSIILGFIVYGLLSVFLKIISSQTIAEIIKRPEIVQNPKI